MSDGPFPSTWKLVLSFTFALVVANVSGAQYVYPSFGTALAEHFQWSAMENSFVSTATFLGVSFSGPLCAKLVETFGDANALRIAATFGFTGFFLLSQTFADNLPNSFALCVIYLLMIGIGGATGYLVALDSQVHNFRAHRGLTMGMTSAALSLCGLVFSQINDHFFKEDSDTYSFLIFMAFVVAGGQLAGSFIVRSFNHDHEATGHNSADINADEEATPLLNPSVKEEEPSKSGWRFFTDPIGFSLFLSLFVLLGVGYVYLAELGQILLSLPTEEGSTPHHIRNNNVSVFSFFNFASRIVFGLMSDSLKSRFRVHRIWFLLTACLILAATMFYGAFYVTNAHDLIPCTILVATTYGTGFGIGPAITSEFGIDVFARNWGWLLFAPAFGTQVFSFVFGAFYDYEARNQDSHTCEGPACYGRTFVLGGVLALLSAAWTAGALIRRRSLTTRSNHSV